MKRMIPILIIASVLVISAKSLYALDISIGAGGWYNWWKPSWYKSDWQFNYLVPPPPPVYVANVGGPGFSTQGGFFGGPLLAIRFLDKWKISAAFIYGTFRFKEAGQSAFFLNDPGFFSGYATGDQIYDRTVHRYDIDTSLSYALTDWLNLLVGFKAQGYSYSDLFFVNGFPTSSRYSMADYGPALGFGVTVPVYEGLFFLCNINALFMSGRDDTIFRSVIGFIPAGHGRFYSYGGTAQGSLAYVFSSINTTVSLGFRYQLLYYRQRSVSFLEYNGRYDSIYGVTLSAVYTFNLSR